MSTPLEQNLAALAPWIARHERPAWVPQITPGDSDMVASKFSGRPLLQAGERWPVCSDCGLPMELLLQLDLASLPSELGDQYGEGLLQLFYCVRDTDCERGWEPFAEQSSLCRVISTADVRPAPDAHGQFPAKVIDGWTRIVDRPDPMEHDRLGLVTNYHFNAVPFQPAEMRCPELDFRLTGINEIEKFQETVKSQSGDKLAGWPSWVQGVEYPDCSDCGTTMQLVMQLDSEDHIPYMFGDCGTGHITQCPVHKQIVAFGWACC